MVVPISETKPPAGPRLLSYQELDILHALRGFCAFYVVVFHAKLVLWSGGTEYLRYFPRATWGPGQYVAFAADVASSAGYEMVIFFFVLSGFFIRYAQLKKYRPAFRFYLNRVVRIYPPYLASLALGAGVVAYLAHAHPGFLAPNAGQEATEGLRGTWQELQNLTLPGLGRALLFLKPKGYFLGGNIVYWSLLPEALFYLLVPLAFWRVKYYYALSAACYAFGMVAAAFHFNGGILSDYVFLYNGYFALGVGLYDVVTTQANWLPAFRRASGLGLALAQGTLLALLIGAAALHRVSVSGPLAAVLAVLSISTLLAGRVSRQNPLVRVFHELGIFSFSLYLYHFPLLLLAFVGLVGLTGNLINYVRYYWLALPLVTAGCYALYCVTERLAVRYFRGT